MVKTDAVLRANALPRLKQLLNSEKSNLVKEAAWAVSNVVAGTPEQIQKVIDADILPDIIKVLFKVGLLIVVCTVYCSARYRNQNGILIC